MLDVTSFSRFVLSSDITSRRYVIVVVSVVEETGSTAPVSSHSWRGTDYTTSACLTVSTGPSCHIMCTALVLSSKLFPTFTVKLPYLYPFLFYWFLKSLLHVIYVLFYVQMLIHCIFVVWIIFICLH